MNTVREYDDKEFKEHFRLNRSIVELIISKYDHSLINKLNCNV